MKAEKYSYLQQLVIPVMQAQIVQSPLPTFLRKSSKTLFILWQLSSFKTIKIFYKNSIRNEPFGAQND